MYCPGENATDPIWRVLASSNGISSWTPLKPQHSNPNPYPNALVNRLWCIDFLTPPTSLIIHHRLPAFLESLMLLKNWCSIHVRYSKSSLKHSIRFRVSFSKGTWYLSLTLSIIRYGSRIKRSNLGKRVAPSPTPRCSSYWSDFYWIDNLSMAIHAFPMGMLAVNEILLLMYINWFISFIGSPFNEELAPFWLKQLIYYNINKLYWTDINVSTL